VLDCGYRADHLVDECILVENKTTEPANHLLCGLRDLRGLILFKLEPRRPQ
jgi:hypothetical protein